MPSIRAAVVQAEPAPSLRDGLERARTLARDAASHGAQLVVFPETWIPGYPIWLDVSRDVALWDHPPVKAVYRRMAENSVVVAKRRDEHPGVHRARQRDHARDGRRRTRCRRARGRGRSTTRSSRSVRTARCSIITASSCRPTPSEWSGAPATRAAYARPIAPFGRVGALVCWEHWMPLARHAMHESGEDIHVALWPTVHEMHQVASRQYAFEGRCYVLAAGSVMRASALPRRARAASVEGAERRSVGSCAAAARSSRPTAPTSPVRCTTRRRRCTPISISIACAKSA